MIHFVVTLKRRMIARFDVDGDLVRIGRHPDNEVQIDNGNVSRFHAQLRRDPGSDQWTLEDQGSNNGTYVNGARVKTKSMRPGDVIGVGPFSVSLELEPAGAGAQARVESPISVRSGAAPEVSEQLAPLKGYVEFQDRSGHIMINRDVTQLGSAPGLDIHLEGPPKAVLIVRGYGGFQLVNCRPGEVRALVNGAHVSDRAWLQAGARVEIGSNSFSFYVGLPHEEQPTLQIDVSKYRNPPKM